ncbi:Crp/Fnr family transcriptional regulator [Pontibacter oryzae]|nr:Crp/Fnr family transcriptional regulator [Pontibacter oryzae]
MQDYLFSDYRARLVTYIANHQEQLQQQYMLQLAEAGQQHVLLHQDARTQQVYLVASGLVKVTRTTSSGQAFTLGVFDRGQPLGELEVMMGIPNFCTVQALTHCTLYCIPAKAFLQMLAQEPAFNILMHQATASMLLNTTHKASILGTNRLLYTLLIVLRELSMLNELKLSKSLLAEFLGTSVRNLNRLLAQLEAEKILQLRNASIGQINLPLLIKRIQIYETTIH